MLPWQVQLEQAVEILNDLRMLGDGNKFTGYRTPKDKAQRL